MKTEHIKLFSGSSIIINRLQNILESNNISSLLKNKFESARLAGFGEQMNSVEIFVLNKDIEKATLILNEFKVEINT